MARGRGRGSSLWLVSVVAACAVVGLLILNAPSRTAKVAVRAPRTETTQAPLPTDTAATVDTNPHIAALTPTTEISGVTATLPDVKRRSNTTTNRRARTAATTSPTSPGTVAVTAETTPGTIAPSLPAPKPLIAHLAITG